MYCEGTNYEAVGRVSSVRLGYVRLCH